MSMHMESEYINRGELLAEIEKHFETIGANAERLVARFPAADVEPVVRCKDCKWYETGVCDFLGAVTLDDDYCSIGARMERSGSGE